MTYGRIVSTAFLLLSVGASLAACGSGNDLDCEVAIIGGGVGGLHTAFRLGPTLGDRVCLFEKDTQLGGRIYDVSYDGSDSSPRVGAGARRVMETQEVLFSLASELGMQLEKPNLMADLIEARGQFSFIKDDLRVQYPSIPPDPDPNADQETWFYDQLRKGPERSRAAQYSDFRSYIRGVIGGEGYEFLRDMSRFRADFDYSLDARGYLDYLDEEWDVCCTPSYPVGGMSEFPRRMEAKATEAGVRIFKSTLVKSIARDGDRYRITTLDRTARASKVVIAIPPYWLKDVGGDVPERLRLQPQFQEIIGVRAVTITQWWPSAWWTQVKNPNQPQDNRVWRAWTTDHCLNFIEIPVEPYAAAQKVTRSVYNDDIRCVQFWEDLARSGPAAVEAEIQRGLLYLFNANNASVPASVTIPKPMRTFVQIWPDAWHWLRAGSTFTNADIFRWAAEPLSGEDVSLVGEAYNPQRSGWSDAAYKSSLYLLNTKYGMKLAGLPQTLRQSSAPRYARGYTGR